MVRHLELLPGGPADAAAAQEAGAAPEHDAPLEDRIFELIYRQMRALVGASPELDDLVQAAAEQALRSLATFERRAELATWTYRICYFTLLKYQRWTWRWCRRFVFGREGVVDEHQDPRISAVDALQLRERQRRLREALERVSPKRRAVVILHDLEGMSVEETAQVVSVKPTTVRSRLRDGRKCLARELRRDPYFGDDACQKAEET
jgi:RNA polymerase sigma-70 factor (ECF subfamily)